jgi:hypothetical protein
MFTSGYYSFNNLIKTRDKNVLLPMNGTIQKIQQGVGSGGQITFKK